MHYVHAISKDRINCANHWILLLTAITIVAGSAKTVLFLNWIHQRAGWGRLRNTHYSKMGNIDYLAFGYAALVAAGGVLGYVKAGSTASLGMGLLFGTAIAYGAYQTTQNPNNYLIGLGTSAVLTGVMGSRFMHSGKFMPAGLVATMSAAMVLRYVLRSFSAKSPVASD